jgi:hypothetical protein
MGPGCGRSDDGSVLVLIAAVIVFAPLVAGVVAPLLAAVPTTRSARRFQAAPLEPECSFSLREVDVRNHLYGKARSK